MIEGYYTINEIAEIWDVSPRRVRSMCLNGQVLGAAKLGREWAISKETEKPKDKRVTTGAYKNLRREKEN